MKVAIIAPSALLRKYAVTDYHLCLCHRILSDDVYASFYSHEVRGFVILDNSAHELGVGGMLMDMKRASDLVHPDEVVLPDRLFFSDDTIKYSSESIDEFRRLAPRVMGVPQGTTPSEWERCCRELIEMGVNTIGISKDYEGWEGGLPKLVATVRHLAWCSWQPQVDAIHMLGWGRQLWQLNHLRAIQDSDPTLPIRGVDSAKPLVFAAHGVDLSRNNVTYPGRLENFFDLSELPEVLALSNINCFRLAAGDHV